MCADTAQTPVKSKEKQKFQANYMILKVNECTFFTKMGNNNMSTVRVYANKLICIC